MNDWVSRLIRPDVQALHAYHVADPGQALRLNQMENPYGWSAELWRECLDYIQGAEINRYPDAGAQALIRAIRDHDSLSDDWGVMLGNGSDEIIQTLVQAVCDGTRPVMAPTPSFVMFHVIAQQCRVPFEGVELAQDWSLDLPAFIQAMQTHNPALVFLAQPNNPTGKLYDEQQLRQLIAACPGLVVLDEAYGPFSPRNHQAWLDEFPNLVLMRTFSKLGLAGLRCGYLTGPSAWIDQINKVRLPYNLGVLNQRVAEFALTRGRQAMADQAKQLVDSREYLVKQFRNRGWVAHDSDANFILLEVEQPSEVFAQLVQAGILIKDLSSAHPSLVRCLRVSIGTPDENRALLDALDQILSETR